MPRGPRRVDAARSAAASRRTSARKASPAAARTGRRIVEGQAANRAAGGRRNSGQRWTSGPLPRTRQQLYQEAKARNIKGRSTMTKAQLERALRG